VTRARRAVAPLLAGALLLSAGAVAADAPLRIHRLFLPPPPTSSPAPSPAPTPAPAPAPAPLATSLSVDEKEWAVTPSKKTVAAGVVTIQVYNRGMDDHDLTLVGANGTKYTVSLAPGAQGQLTPSLPAGDYKLFCSLFAGTPASHEALGMSAVLQVR
jgi:hypothetical protein